MANQIEKLNNIAIASIEKLNGLTDAQMEKVNTLEWTGVVQAGSYSVSSATLSTARSRCAGFAVARSASAVVGGNNTSAAKLDSCEEYDGSAVSSGGTLGTARFGLTGCGSQTVGLILGGTA
jgi:predicted enzyme related to lactoylglutathione lyase